MSATLKENKNEVDIPKKFELPNQNLIENVGEFKLKNKGNRNNIRVGFENSRRDTGDLIAFGITKDPNSNNRFRIILEWKPELKKVQDMLGKARNLELKKVEKK